MLDVQHNLTYKYKCVVNLLANQVKLAKTNVNFSGLHTLHWLQFFTESSDRFCDAFDHM